MEQWEVHALLGNSQDTGLLNGADKAHISLADFRRVLINALSCVPRAKDLTIELHKQATTNDVNTDGLLCWAVLLVLLSHVWPVSLRSDAPGSFQSWLAANPFLCGFLCSGRKYS